MRFFFPAVQADLSNNIATPMQAFGRNVARLLSILCLMLPLCATQALAGWDTDVTVPIQEDANAICPDENTDPWESGSAAINPGAWANFRRSGTGWEFIYSNDRTQMKAIHYTFSRYGKPTWLASDMVDLQSDGNWKAKFYKYVATSSTTTTKTHKGSVAVRFFANDPSRVAVRWSWEELDQVNAGNQLECIQDFNRAGPDVLLGNPPPSTPTAPNSQCAAGSVCKGPNNVFGGFWNTAGSSDVNKVPGETIAIMQNTAGDATALFTEVHTITTFDAVGQPVWLTAQKPMNEIFTLPTWGELPIDVNLIIPNSTKYPSGVPVNDCLMWQNYTGNNRCWTNVKVGDYVRTFTQYGPEIGKEGTARFTFLQTAPGAQPAPFYWSGTPQPLLGAYFWPGTSPQTIKKIVDSDGIVLNRLAYRVGLDPSQYDEFWVSWNHWFGGGGGGPHLGVTAWRHDLNTSQYVKIGLSPNGNNGYTRDPLPAGSRVQYELWDGVPNASGSVLYAKTPEARVYGPRQAGDSTDGAAASTPSIAPFVEPTASASSDSVGAIAGQFRVDEMGNAGYQIPLVVSAGKGGLTPQLAISYNSGGGDGYLGAGMSLSGVSSISACRPGVEFGDTLGLTVTPSEFCLDGQRLLLTSGTHRQLNAQYHTEIDSMTLVVITGETATNVVGAGQVTVLEFTAYGKDGSVRKFGGPGGVTVTRSLENFFPIKTIAWQQTSLTDVVGNTIAYTYSTLDDTGERTLNSISYGGGSIIFNYVSSSRVDVAYSALGASRRTKLMTSIEVRGPAPTNVLRYYTWDYSSILPGVNAQGARPRIAQIRECSSSPSSSPPPVCYAPTVFTWQDPTGAVQGFSGDLLSEPVKSLKPADFNGDGRADLIWQDETDSGNAEKLYVSYSQTTPGGSGIAFPAATVITNPAGIPDEYAPGNMWEVVDLNGDGRDDILYGHRDAATNRLNLHKISSGSCPSTPCFGPPEPVAEIPDLGVPAPPPTGVVRVPGSSMLADMNGDGLPDLFVRGSDRRAWVLVRDLSVSSQFKPPIPAEFVDTNGTSPCPNFYEDITRRLESSSQALDIDGDGRADLRAFVNGGVFTCSGAMPPALNTPTGLHTYRMESFRSLGVQLSPAGEEVLRFQRDLSFGDVVFTTDSPEEVSIAVRSLDVNADGLMDLVYASESSSNQWKFRLNGKNVDTCIVNCSLTGNRTKVQLIDYDGDGKPDFWFPADHVSTYNVFLWKGDGFQNTPISTSYEVYGDSKFRLPADFDGDGQVDNFALDADGGDWRVQRGQNHHRRLGVIKQIKDGFQAVSDITYAPLTYSSAYRRDYNGASLALGSGKGSAVFDIGGPSYVVSYVKSSAPTQGEPNDQAVVRYRYAGLKVQAGGRGSLGFRRISTLDLQTAVEIDTWYNQAFPLTGTAYKTWTRKLQSIPLDACTEGSPDSSTCMAYTPVCSGGLDSDCDTELPSMNKLLELNASIIKESLDSWEHVRVAAIAANAPKAVSAPKAGPGPLPVIWGGPILLVKDTSLTRNFDPSHGNSYPNPPTHSESTIIPIDEYDQYGNPGESTVTQSSAGFTITSESVFDYSNFVSLTGTIQWRLGRLNTSKVKTTRSPSFPATGGTSLRQSSFTYQAQGLLESERVEGMTGTFPALVPDPTARGVATYYTYDSAGNRTGVRTCSTSVSPSNCGSDAYVKGKFHPGVGEEELVARYTKTVFDPSQRFSDSTSELFWNGTGANEVSIASVTARNSGGDPLEMSSANGLSTKIRYGALGRKYFSYANTGASSRTDWAMCGSNCPANMALAYVMTTITAGAPTTKTFFDKIGRPTVTLQRGFGFHVSPPNTPQWIGSITYYDARGNVEKQSNPYFAHNDTSGAATVVAMGDPMVWTQTDYDYLNRPISVTAPGSGTTTIDYSGLDKTTTLPENKNDLAQWTKETRNGAGEVVSTQDALGLITSFEFDAAGNQTRMSQSGRNTDMVYDSLGRKKSMTDPDMGTWTYEVNHAGETIRQLSPRGTCTTSLYDGRGRVWQRNDYVSTSCSGDPEAQANWEFDTKLNGKGALALENSKVNGVTRVTRTPTYDTLGRGISVDTVLDGKTYKEESTYDQFGRAFQGFFTAPGVNKTGELIQYNGQGYQYRVRSAYPNTSGIVYSEVVSMNARGQVVDERRMAGAQVITSRGYDINTGRLKRILTAGGYLQDLNYDYDELGNVTYREDATDLNAILREDFNYDKLQRLLDSTVKRNGVIQPGQQSYTFAADGNISTKTGLSGSYVYATRPTQCNAVPGSVTPGPHAVSLVNNTSYCYDANGNLLRSVVGSTIDRNLVWTAYDMTASVRSALANTKVGFDYGPNRERIRRLDYAAELNTSADTVTHFVGGAEVRWTVNPSTNGANTLQEVRRYVGGVIIVQRGTGNAYTIKREYLLTDAQGSTYAVLDDYGMPINASARMSFDPFGKRRAAFDWTTAAPWTINLGLELKDTTRRGYTGHEQVDAVGIIHMGGRIYDPQLGRFLQADPFIQAPGNSQSLNRYSYVFNNPMAYTDPTGYWGAKEQAGLRTVVAIVIAAYTGYYATSVVEVFAGGFAAGAVQSGTLRGATMGGISSLAFFGIGKAFPVKGMSIATGEGIAAYSELALASGITGGVLAQVQGGRFGNGFVSAGANALLAPIPEAASSNAGMQTVIAAVIGGTISEATGGKFSNGAVTAAFQFAVGRGFASTSARKRDAYSYSDAELQAFVDQSPRYGMDMSLNEDFLNSSKGIGDSLSFGGTKAFREWMDGAPDAAVDTDAYSIGYYGSMLPGLLRLGAYAAAGKSVSMIGSAIGGLEGAIFANSSRNIARIIGRFGFSGYGKYPFPEIYAKYGGDLDAIIAASGRTNSYVNQVGLVAGGAQGAYGAAKCIAGQPGC